MNELINEKQTFSHFEKVKEIQVKNWKIKKATKKSNGH